MDSTGGLDSNDSQPRLFVPITDLLNCPCGVLCNQWLGVGYRAFERGKIGWIAHIAERYTDIS